MNDVFLCRWDPAARLRVRGPDAAVFLQGQFTNELRSTSAQPCTYGLWLNQKGRVLADSFVLGRGGDEFDVVSLTSSAAVIRERLESYIIADDVTVEDATDGEGWVLGGDGIGSVLNGFGLEAPRVGEFAAAGDVVAFRARAAQGRNWFILAPASTPGLRLAEFRAVSRQDLARNRIEAGIPEVPSDLGPGDLPQEGGLEPEAISFTKGCYLGQEVMARLHNMGQVRRRLFVTRTPADAPRGTELFLGDRRVGEVRALAPDGTNGAIGLAMLQTAHVQPGAGLAPGPGGPATIEVLRLADGRAW